MSIVEIKIPSPGESITEVEIGHWLKADGDYVLIDETICEIETDKATLPLIAESAGRLKILLQEGETAGIGDVACSIDTDAKQPKITSSPTSFERATIPDVASSASVSYAAGHPSPAAKKMMAEKGATGVSGSGPGGRITTQDVEMHLQQNPDYAASTTETKLEASPPVVSGSRSKKRERMSRLRRKLAERLVAVKNETAMLTTFNEVDMHAIFELRSQSKEAFLEKFNIKLGYMGLFTKACTEALKDFPAVNAQIDGDQIVYHDYVDMGIAVSAPKGLMVPVVRNAESLSLAQIEIEIGRLAKRARENKLSIDEMEGGTFSITNGGVFGSMLSTPILNPPQSAILGMHNIVERPMAVEGKVEIRPVMYLALSYDHRIVDGQQSVSFLVRVKEFLQNPTRMLV
ncbi:MAG TPA: 2-oxoglutarate dehydrogenase complex dihydrolipoyllysine-residue succinyltransferase [Candidatus Lambdaproteobacteria bacterium]|nr:2-oxoglutarate dehydrogenase complex dihydrolipoyllysine-residue succinyltransferase [Candidatus Lambdaproteobacteria bacterium]